MRPAEQCARKYPAAKQLPTDAILLTRSDERYHLLTIWGGAELPIKPVRSDWVEVPL